MTLHPRTQSLVAAATATLIAGGCSAGHTDVASTARAQRLPTPETRAAGVAAAGDDVATLRAEGPAALDRLLAAHDAATGDQRAALAALVDRVAGQRYATVSRLFWYTDLPAARAAATAAGKPILSLRLLGRLDEDQSCANSRFFRVALYGDAALSAWLREHFILHWSSERPVPKVTIDFGDGRRIETTAGGNSAHYVLDADGAVLDIIPGLMTPRAFRHQLEGALALSAELDAPGGDRAHAAILERHHAGQVEAIGAIWRQLDAMAIPVITWGTSLAQAERAAMSKARVELPVVKTARLGADPSSLTLDSAAWEQIGIRVLASLGLEQGGVAGKAAWAAGEVDNRVLPPPGILDAQSRALVEALAPIDWSARAEPLTDEQRAALIAAFEATIVADSGVNLTRLREQIHAELASRAGNGLALDFASINEWLYGTVFMTPRADPWLGMATPSIFTGLPGDGVRVR